MARDTSMEERTDESLLDVAKRRFKLAQETEEKQREREKDDLRFQIPEEQCANAGQADPEHQQD
jgi:hypothetical protein